MTEIEGEISTDRTIWFKGRKKSMKKQNIRESSRLKSQENTKMNSAYEDTIVTAPILTQFQKHRRLATMENLQAK